VGKIDKGDLLEKRKKEVLDQKTTSKKSEKRAKKRGGEGRALVEAIPRHKPNRQEEMLTKNRRPTTKDEPGHPDQDTLRMTRNGKTPEKTDPREGPIMKKKNFNKGTP